jgi:hypothetical protein
MRKMKALTTAFNPVQSAMIPGKARDPEETYAYNLVQILRICGSVESVDMDKSAQRVIRPEVEAIGLPWFA